jgi:hypothetical protein
MKSHWLYLKYVLRHKWHVFVGCMALGVPLHQAIIHDWVKFLPIEWFPYVHNFYGPKPIKRETTGEYDASAVGGSFDAAWNHHQKTQPHHWQHWVLITDSDEPRLRALQIPQRFVLEMVADWYGAGMAITGKPEMEAWYKVNKHKMILHEITEYQIEIAILEAKDKGLIP